MRKLNISQNWLGQMKLKQQVLPTICGIREWYPNGLSQHSWKPIVLCIGGRQPTVGTIGSPLPFSEASASGCSGDCVGWMGEWSSRRSCCPSSSMSLLRQSRMRRFSVRLPEVRFCAPRSKLNLFLSAFSVLPAMNLAISDHFFAPSSSRTYSSSLRSSQGDHGPLWMLGFRKQFQCSLHCLGVRKALFLAGFRSQSNCETSFQCGRPCSVTAQASRRDSALDHL